MPSSIVTSTYSTHAAGSSSGGIVPSSPTSGPRPLQLIDGNVQPINTQTTTAYSSSPSYSSACASSPAQIVHGLPSPSTTTRTNGNPRRQPSISYFPSDHTPYWARELPSPMRAVARRSASSIADDISASMSAGGRRNRRSTGSLDVLTTASVGPVRTTAGLENERERGPLTLTEKHADLLQFIAQKESKCLELRAQLAAHEAELRELKRKWERVVSRGADHAYASTPVPSVSSNASASANAAVLVDGIKEGVQGVGRLLVAGLGDLASPVPASYPSSSPSPSTPIRARKSGKGHGSTQSMSSASTHTPGSSASSVRLSQSSASSLLSDEPLRESDEEREREQQAEETRAETCDGELVRSASTGAASTSALRAAKIRRRKSRDAAPAPSPLVASHVLTADVSDRHESVAASVSTSTSPSPSSFKTARFASGLPPPSSIPGLGPMTSPSVSSWMESVGSSVGRKWDEIQKGGTFSKSQKRASLLLSDVSQSLFAALSSPSPSSPSFTHSLAQPNKSAPSHPFAASPSPQTPSPLVPVVSFLEDDDAEDRSRLSLGSVLIPEAKAPPSPVKPMSLTPAARRTTSKAPSFSTNAGTTTHADNVNVDDDDEWGW